MSCNGLQPVRPDGPIRPLIDDNEGDENRQNKTPKKAISPSMERVIEGLVGGISITEASCDEQFLRLPEKVPEGEKEAT